MNAAANEGPSGCLKCELVYATAGCGGWCGPCMNAARRNLTPGQRVLLARALERHDEAPEQRPRITLETDAEIRAAMGLERRKLCLTDRPTRRPWALGRPRAVRGSVRTMRLTDAGIVLARLSGPVPRRYVVPATVEELRRIARGLAVLVLEDGNRNGAPSQYLRNRARAVLERIDAEGGGDA